MRQRSLSTTFSLRCTALHCTALLSLSSNSMETPKSEEAATSAFPPLQNSPEDDEDNDDGEEEEEEEEEMEHEDDDDEYVEEEDKEAIGDDEYQQRERFERAIRRLSSEKVKIRVHDVIIKGNTKTNDSLIESELEVLRDVKSMQELFQAAAIANARLQALDIFDSVSITLDSGPKELPGTANVVVNVEELKNPLSGDFGIFSKPQARSWSLEAALKLKNLLGYGDIWEGSGSYGWDQTTEISTGVSLPRLGRFTSPLSTRLTLLSQDWSKFSSYHERLLGLSVGLISTRRHDLSYNLTWRTLTDPSHMASKAVRRQLGHSLLSSVKYTFKLDRRDSRLRPTRGYAFVSTSQISGLDPDSRSLRFIRQELDLRYALPLGFFKSALNLGVSAGVILPLGKEFLGRASPLPDRFFMGGLSSPVCSFGGPTSLLGFKYRGLGPTESRRVASGDSKKEPSDEYHERDVLGGDLAVTAFADLSFDLPVKVLRESGIHGHLFACAGNLAKLSENEYQNFSLKKFGQSFRSSIGGGIIIPTKLFRVEINYCHILKQFDDDRGKSGLQFNFSSPS